MVTSLSGGRILFSTSRSSHLPVQFPSVVDPAEILNIFNVKAPYRAVVYDIPLMRRGARGYCDDASGGPGDLRSLSLSLCRPT